MDNAGSFLSGIAGMTTVEIACSRPALPHPMKFNPAWQSMPE